jgi:folate-binding protein YgfZ
MNSPLLNRPGAVPAAEPDAGVAAHYGDPFAEQRALAGLAGPGGGVVDRSNRSVIRITGPDRLSWLHSLTTQHLERLSPAAATEALVLSPNGHVQHHLTLTDDGEALWAHLEPGTAAALIEFLESMRFLLRVEPTDVSAQFAVLTIMGAAPAAEPPTGTTAAIRLPYTLDLIVARRQLDNAVAELESRGGRLAGLWAHEALRIAAGRPRLGLDTDHRTIPHEAGWVGSAVHLDKGCYRGQETVARVHNLGHPPRRLVLLHLDGSEDALPRHGDPVELDGTAVGFVGSAARHYELGPVALGLVKRTVPTAATLTAAGIPAAQEVIVPPDAGAHVDIKLRGRSIGLARPR